MSVPTSASPPLTYYPKASWHARLHYAWWMVLFSMGLLLTGLLMLPLRLLPYRKAQPVIYAVFKAWAWWCQRPAGLHIHWPEGKPPLPYPCVMVSNHRSQLDIQCARLAHDHPFQFVAKAELGKIPFLGGILRRYHILVDRKSIRSRGTALERMQQGLVSGHSIFAFVEGKRHPGPDLLGAFSAGAFQLACSGPYPLAMLTLAGTGEKMPAAFHMLRGGKIYAWWDVMPADQVARYRPRELRDEAQRCMHARLKAYYDSRPFASMPSKP